MWKDLFQALSRFDTSEKFKDDPTPIEAVIDV